MADDVLAVRLGAVARPPQARLDGFKTRQLRVNDSVAARHLYVTDWRALLETVAVAGGTMVVVGDGGLEPTVCTPLAGAPPPQTIHAGQGPLVADATRRAQLALLPVCALGAALALAQEQALAADATPTTVRLVSAGAQAAWRPEGAGAWGLARSVRAEQPSVRLQCVEVVVAGACGAWPEAEAEVVHHGTACLVPRLKTAPPEHDGPTRLHLHSRGAIDNLFVEPLPTLAPTSSGQVLLHVRAVGLNFRDVLNVLGEYPGDPGPPGGDAAGLVDAAPSNPLHGALADAVFGLGHAPLASLALAAAPLVARPMLRTACEDEALDRGEMGRLGLRGNASQRV